MDYLRKEIVRSIRNELKEMLKDALGNALSPTAQNPSPQYYSPTTTPSPSPQTAVTPTSTQSNVTKNKNTSFSRAPTLEAPSSPLLSPTSATLRVPQISLGSQSLSTGPKKSLSNAGASNLSTSSPVLLCPITESERAFKQMYTQI